MNFPLPTPLTTPFCSARDGVAVIVVCQVGKGRGLLHLGRTHRAIEDCDTFAARHRVGRAVFALVAEDQAEIRGLFDRVFGKAPSVSVKVLSPVSPDLSGCCVVPPAVTVTSTLLRLSRRRTVSVRRKDGFPSEIAVNFSTPSAPSALTGLTLGGCEHCAVFAAGVRRAQRPAQDGAGITFVAAERFLVVADRELDRAQAGVVLDHHANLKALSSLDVLRCFDAYCGRARAPLKAPAPEPAPTSAGSTNLCGSFVASLLQDRVSLFL